KTGDKIEITLPDLPDTKVDGKIEELSYIATEAPDKSMRFNVRARLSDDKVLRPGSKAKIEIHGDKLKKVVSLPRKAIVNEEGKTYCWVKSGDKPAEKREITLGASNRERVQILRGLNDNEIVVIK